MKPREKLLNLGVSALSDAELLAILLKTGGHGKTVKALAHEILTHFGSLRQLLHAGPADFCQFSGAGLVKYTTLQAALELSNRFWRSTTLKQLRFQNFAELSRFLMAKLAQREQEVFAVIFLSAKLETLAYEELFFGSITHSAIHPRELLKRALKHNAAALIVAHNHPSGDPTPSSSDRQLTEELRQLLRAVDIELLQHVVVGHNHCHAILEH